MGTNVKKENSIMATPIRPIPILTGEAAERFVRMADAAEGKSSFFHDQGQ